MVKISVSQVRKALVAVAGVIGQLIALGLLTGPVLRYAAVGLSILTAAGIYSVPNADPASAPADDSVAVPPAA
jgi:uncharacterized membrane protein YphA (DoxX/SURF4 family)